MNVLYYYRFYVLLCIMYIYNINYSFVYNQDILCMDWMIIIYNMFIIVYVVMKYMNKI